MMYRPKIIGFICNWSLPTGISTASTNRIQGHPKVRIIRVMCVGRIDPIIVLETFAKGADGVLIIGCHPPDCHYIDGNLHAEGRIKMLKKLIRLTGLEPERLQLGWAYASEIERVAKIVNDFRNQIMVLGPSPLIGKKPDTDILLNMKAAKAAAEDFRLRVLVGRERELTEGENAYGERISLEEFDALLHEVVEGEFIRHKISRLTEEKPMSIREIAASVNMKPTSVLRHIVNMRSKGMVALDRVERRTPLYKSIGGPVND